jgi:integrase
MLRIPKISLHSSGQWYVRITGKSHYLGKNKDAAEFTYRQLIIDHYGPSQVAFAIGGGITVEDLLNRYSTYHVDESSPEWQGKRRACMEQVCRHAISLYGNLPAESFGPLAFKEVRKSMGLEKGRSRPYVNSLCSRLRSAFRWGVSEELVSQQCYDRLMTVHELSVGQLKLPEGKDVRPVDLDTVNKTLEFLNERMGNIVKLLLLTGARPREILSIKPCELEVDNKADGKGWAVYRPKHHKTEKKNLKRAVVLNPEAMAILTPRWPSNPSKLFFPSVSNPSKPFTAYALRQAVRRACIRGKIPIWHPYQIRHRVLTDIALQHGREVAQAVGGHANVIMTAHYDHGVLERARKAMG